LLKNVVAPFGSKFPKLYPKKNINILLGILFLELKNFVTVAIPLKKTDAIGLFIIFFK
jgi:hypothetical protein